MDAEDKVGVLREDVVALLSHFEELERAVVGLYGLLCGRGYFLGGNHACEEIDTQ